MHILTLDPGTSHLGAGLLDIALGAEPICLWHSHLSTMDPCRSAPDDAIVRWYLRLQGLVKQHKPQAIVYEGYEWQGEERTTSNSPLMWQQLGAIRVLGAMACIEATASLSPSVWRRQLTRNRHAKDDEVAYVIKARLGVEPLKIYGNTRGSHVLDALGVGLAWGDTWRLEQREVG